MASSPVVATTAVLGYPDEARLLIINADDFGVCHGNNEATMSALRDGVVTSTTLMTPCPWAPHAIRWLQDHPEIAFGVHLTLVCDFGENYRWGPLAPRGDVSSLATPGGAFFAYEQIPALLAQARIEEVEIEFRAQIDTVLDARLAPTHLDWHCIADGGREDIFELTFRLAREYGLAMRVHHRVHADSCREQGLPVVDFDVLDSYHIPPAEKPARYTELLRSLPAGLTEWAAHFGNGDGEARALEPENWKVRRADYDYFTSPEARAVIEEEGIVLLSYRELQPLWKGDPA